MHWVQLGSQTPAESTKTAPMEAIKALFDDSPQAGRPIGAGAAARDGQGSAATERRAAEA
jgi:hypothetical protein